MSSVRCRWIGVLLALGWALGARPGVALDLELADVKLSGGELRFHTNLSEPVDTIPIAPNGENVEAASTSSYLVLISLDDISLSKFGYFRYRFYVKPKPGVSGGLTSFVVTGTPSGSFLGQTIEVDFYVGESTGKREQAKIPLPIFSLESPAYLAAPHWDRPEEVEIGGETEIPIRLQNLLQKWPVTVESVRQTSSKGLWRKVGLLVKGSEEFRPFEIQPAEAIDDVLVLRLVPNSGQALSKALFPRHNQGEQAKVSAHLDYSTRLGVPRSLEIEIPVRFVPWPPYLFLVVVAGTLFGSLIPVVVGQRPRKKWLQAFGASLLTAILAELIAMVLVQHDSEFRLLGFALDPFQLLPAALIGALMGLLGFASLQAIKRVIPKWGGGAAQKPSPEEDK